MLRYWRFNIGLRECIGDLLDEVSLRYTRLLREELTREISPYRRRLFVLRRRIEAWCQCYKTFSLRH